ncbi:MAG TPA: hypothetical protein VLA36_08520 [Longimicrobiales bacterium]|nr:hypothetical protein [Longimicrobiales bacterium]
MKKVRIGAICAGILALSLAVTVPATGQQPAADNDGHAAALAEANSLRAEAAELYSTRNSNWDKVVRLHVKAAGVAPKDDPMRMNDFWMAGVVSESLGNLREAQLYMERAADLALEIKDNFRAGEVYLAAAIVSARRGEYGKANLLLDRAESAADPDVMDAKLCDGLRERIAMLRGGGF